MKECFIWCLILGCRDWGKADLILDILKHQPRGIHEETGLSEHIFCLLSLPVQIRPAAFAETQQQQKATQAGGFPTNIFQSHEHLNAEDVKDYVTFLCFNTELASVLAEKIQLD